MSLTGKQYGTIAASSGVFGLGIGGGLGYLLKGTKGVLPAALGGAVILAATASLASFVTDAINGSSTTQQGSGRMSMGTGASQQMGAGAAIEGMLPKASAAVPVI